MKTRWIVMAAAVCMVAGLACASPPSATNRADLVDDFAPLFSPPKKALHGLTVGITPAPPTVNASSRSGELALVTAGQLYHLVLAAGGTPVLARSLYATLDANVVAQQPTDCHICLTISYTDASDRPLVYVTRTGTGTAGESLASALLDSIPNSRSGSSNATHAAVGSPAQVAVCLPADSTRGPLTPAQRRGCFERAEQLYAGLAHWKEHTLLGGPPVAERRPVPDYPDDKPAGRYERIAQRVWPTETLNQQQLDSFCDSFTQNLITNDSLVYFDVHADQVGSAVVLKGSTNLPVLAKTLKRTLETFGLDPVRNEVCALPDNEHLGHDPFGVCRVPLALTYRQPGGGGLQTQLLYGAPVYLLDCTHDHYLLHADDGYWGWVPRNAIRSMSADEFLAYQALPVGVLRDDVVHGSLTLPRGATLRVCSFDQHHCTLRLADGNTLEVLIGQVKLAPPAEVMPRRVAAALDLLYTPYVFGGCGPLGLDCSGLVRNVTAQDDTTIIARDAWQQALAGRLVATAGARGNIRAGDQLFFIDRTGRIYHTALAIDGQRFVHSSPPCVRISSFDPDDPLYGSYLDRTFFVAKRR